MGIPWSLLETPVGWDDSAGDPEWGLCSRVCLVHIPVSRLVPTMTKSMEASLFGRWVFFNFRFLLVPHTSLSMGDLGLMPIQLLMLSTKPCPDGPWKQIVECFKSCIHKDKGHLEWLLLTYPPACLVAYRLFCSFYSPALNHASYIYHGSALSEKHILSTCHEQV